MYISDLAINFALFNFVSIVLFKKNEIGEIFFLSIFVSFLQTYSRVKETNTFLHFALIFIIIVVARRLYWRFFK
jgi:hypothetical protein